MHSWVTRASWPDCQGTRRLPGAGRFDACFTSAASTVKTERALAIQAYDYFAALSFGTVAGLASSYFVPDLLATPLATIAGMGVGMLSAFPLLGLFMFLLGGFEIIVMSMQIGMVAGMVGVMTGASGVGTAALAGALTGLVIQLLLHLTNSVYHGEVIPHE